MNLRDWVRRLACWKSHDPLIVLMSSNEMTIAGERSYITECRRCGLVYEQKVLKP